MLLASSASLRVPRLRQLIACSVFTFTLLTVRTQVAAADSLETGFKAPPASARPHTWWHWMNGNVTREGITADLEAMKRVGIGGVQIFNASEGIPPGPAKFLSPEWRSLMTFAAQEANRLGLEICLHNCAGWSSSGGPWNTPEHAMQHVVTSEVQVKGPSHFSGTVPQPPARLDFYREIAVFAFRTPDGEGVTMKSFAPKLSAGEDIDGAKLVDGRAATFAMLPAPETNHPQFIQLEFPQPFTSRTIVLTPGTNMGEVKGVIQVSDDGQSFRDVRDFAFVRRPTRPLGLTLGNESVSARFYRVTFTSAAPGVNEIGPAEIDLSPRLRIENIEAKDGDNGGFAMSSAAANEVASSLVVKRSELIDLTGKLGADGHLDWDAPPGDWTILRLGYTPTGRNNHPAPPEATGLECDKFSKEALDAHWAGFVQKVLDDLGPLAGAGKPFNNVLIDSYEVGGQNWNVGFRDEFKRRRGYDPVPFLPAFTGRVVESPEISERFLWDMRRTIADLFAENYYNHFVELCHARGLLASIEPYTGPFESLQSGAGADIPMGEFWVEGAPHRSVKLASSVGHIYGRTIIGTESFTARPGPQHGRWIDDPYSIKALGDLIFCQGINRYIFHRYAMQPWTNRWPGMTMGQWGTHFDRTSTWWEQGRAWLQYVTRSQFLLQQGRFVADVAYFCGESTPVEMRVDGGNFAAPEGYDFDAINADVLLHGARVQDGRLVLSNGVSYRTLVLPPDDRNITPALLHKLYDFVSEGLTLAGHPPETSPSLQNYPQCDEEIRKFAGEMWGDRQSAAAEHPLGKGKVAWGRLPDILKGLGVEPDFTFAKRDNDRLAFIHRSTGDAEIYFVSNQRDRFDTVECSFRVAGKLPELWNAETGDIQPAPVWREENGRTVVPLSFDPVGSIFVVFRSKAPSDHLVSIQRNGPSVGETRQKPADLRILKAVYGGFVKQVEVTPQVKSLAASGTRRIPASNEMAGDDPAPGMAKRLRIEFTLDSRTQTIEGAEGTRVILPAGAQVVQAFYGLLRTPAGEQTIDVTDKLAALAKTGELNVRADNDLAGRDPALLVPKELRVDYSINGASRHLTVPEGEMLILPETPPSMGAPPPFALTAAGNQTWLWASAPGTFNFTWASGRNSEAQCRSLPAPVELSRDWRLTFPPNWGAPPEVKLDQLISWPEHNDSGVRYFSGTAAYEKEIEIPAEFLRGDREVWLDLGKVKNFADVTLNGHSLALLWKPPFRANLTGAARAGKNRLEVKVTNLWPNRLIGDEQLPADREWEGKRLRGWPQWVLEGKPSPTGRLTFTTWHHWTTNDIPLESGLIGPVTIGVRERVAVPAGAR